MDEFDAYVVHASEDEVFARALTDSLEASGLRIWFNSFRPGGRLRQQMEDGLRRSTVGIVLVSENLFRKQWAVEELDALYALEADRTDRIIPVWVNVSATKVREQSPMLAARSAVLYRDGESMTDVASELRDAILFVASSQSVGQLVRAQIASGFNWRTGPGLLGRSFARYDEEATDYLSTVLCHYPDVPGPIESQVVPLIDLLRAPTAFDGTTVTVCGTQDPGSLQVLDTTDLVLGEDDGTPLRLAAHVFQMRSVDFNESQLVYVHAFGPYAPGYGPTCPPDRLCWVTGVPLAYGSMDARHAPIADAVYIAARSIWTMPKVDQESG